MQEALTLPAGGHRLPKDIAVAWPPQAIMSGPRTAHYLHRELVTGVGQVD
jgi:hypothetical protein